MNTLCRNGRSNGENVEKQYGYSVEQKKKICSLIILFFLSPSLSSLFVGGPTRKSARSDPYIVTSKILPTSSDVFTERSSKSGIISNNSLS